MSRIGRAPITIPAGVTVKVEDGNKVTVKGPKGELVREIHQDMKINIEENTLTVERPSDNKDHRALHGLSRTLLHNMIIGVSEGFAKTLEINGVGYRAAVKGKNLELSLGFSHPVVVEPPEGIKFECSAATKIVVVVSARKLLAQSPQRFATIESQSHIRARVLSTKVSLFVARLVKLARRARNN